MIERIYDVMEKVKKVKVAIGERDGLFILLRFRGGYYPDDESEWIVECIIVSGNEVAPVRKGFDSEIDALHEFTELKSKLGLEETNLAELAMPTGGGL